MTTNVDWPGRGPTWLGVPALVVALVGVLMLADVSYRQNLGHELLDGGGEAVASSVQVFSGRGGLGDVEVAFRTDGGREVKAVLAETGTDDEGMPEGLQAPAPGTRYAPPLTINYRRSDPTVAVASVDAQEWVADRRTPVISRWMIAGGLAVTLVALAGLTRGARRRGVAWWRWFSPAPGD
ncbi:hypothetical protein [Kribbella sp. NPDC051770]|uniref:hypothetical protein n=1 Tax=Kribbella sp. NPDC051770 TaxID=3155413 RepID=UPI003413C216